MNDVEESDDAIRIVFGLLDSRIRILIVTRLTELKLDAFTKGFY
jgi:hypothetical protein